VSTRIARSTDWITAPSPVLVADEPTVRAETLSAKSLADQ